MKHSVPALWLIFLVTTAAANASDITGQKEGDIVHIAPNGVAMPLERILLIRKGKEYCAVKFTKFWESPNGDRFALYEAYSFHDQINYKNPLNFKLRKKELRNPKPQFSIFGHPIAIGTVDEIDCGFCSPWWSGLGSVYFERGEPQGDHGMELSPTKWTDVSQVNLFDPRLKWYRYDEGRRRVDVPVDDLW